MTMGNSVYGFNHIKPDRLKEFREVGYKDQIDFLDDVATNYTHVYEQKNGRLLLVKMNGRKKYSSIELQKKKGDEFYSVTTMFLEGKKLKGKSYEERGERKLLLQVSLATNSGQDVPFIESTSKNQDGSNWRSGQSSKLTGDTLPQTKPKRSKLLTKC